ncbi:MAG: glycosyltransferase, partial [Verrucomicrobiales bacterium]|nr:glycosyltransferase [Verrucomicrobiales bacterium]
VPVSDWVDKANAGWIIEPTVDSVHAALVAAINQPEERKHRGERAIEASANMTYTVTAHRLKDLYQSIADNPVVRVGVSDKLRILHVIPSMSQSQGGPSYAMPLMAYALAQKGMHVDIVTTNDDGKAVHRTDVPLGSPVEKDGYRVIYFSKQTEFYKTSVPLLNWLRANVRGYDLVHIHALFSFSSMAAMVAAREHGIPYIVRPLGVLNAWGMTQRRRFAKQASFSLLDKPLINGAAAIHYTSAQERDDAARLHLTPRPEIVPLGVDLRGFDTMPDGAEFAAKYPELKGKPFVLFLSRIDPKKGLDLLIPAFASSAAAANTFLVIAGRGDPGYEAKLHAAVAQAGLSNRVVWTGHLAGSLKLSALSSATLFVLPSHSENFGIALLEAMAAGCACISSPEVALAKDVAEDNAVEIVPRSIEDWSRALDRLIRNAPRRELLSKNARRVAHERYSLSAMGNALHALYERLLHRGKAALL